MLSELAVRDLGVVAELELVLGPGMTAVTGETGAGKTLIVEAIDLLSGGRADAGAVREGAHEAVVEGRFVSEGSEVILRRVVPAQGRSRAYVDGAMATAAALSEIAARHVDLYAQHAQHSLMTTAGQRAALDGYAGTDLGPLLAARADERALAEELASLGGDRATREREMDLLTFQIAELDEADLTDPDEDERLAVEEAALGDVAASRDRIGRALVALDGEAGALESLGSAVGELSGSDAFVAEHDRLHGLLAELNDAASDLRRRAERIIEDPQRLEWVIERRQHLATLRRRHGDGTLGGVIAEHHRLRERLAALEAADERGAELADALQTARGRVDSAAARVAAIRRAAAPRLAAAVEAELRALAMPAAHFGVDVGGPDPGDGVEMVFTANPGTSVAPLARTASGGELARAMLALRLVATADQETVVFDEVDAGIGGTAAIAVGAALARLARDRQVLVVTHLAQVAAAADSQVGVTKGVSGGVTTTKAEVLDGEARVVELSRMLSGRPSSRAARAHARELLAPVAGAPRDD